MDEKDIINVGDIYELKKPHPCGSTTWEVIRTGADIKIKCTKCGHILLMDRPSFRKSIKASIK